MAERAGPVLLAGHLPGGEEPMAQLAGALENRARGRGDLASTRRAHAEATVRAPGRGSHVALRADEALGPPQALQVRDARQFVGEEFAELDESAGVIDASAGLAGQRIGHNHSV